ncbi:MAG TPA: DMT family protein [Caldimonas sp.]|jgi:uncharacterized protein (DUF486 family)
MIESISAPVRTALLLSASNVFMTFAWYGHQLDLLWAALCMVGAVYFVFRDR